MKWERDLTRSASHHRHLILWSGCYHSKYVFETNNHCCFSMKYWKTCDIYNKNLIFINKLGKTIVQMSLNNRGIGMHYKNHGIAYIDFLSWATQPGDNTLIENVRVAVLCWNSPCKCSLKVLPELVSCWHHLGIQEKCRWHLDHLDHHRELQQQDPRVNKNWLRQVSRTALGQNTFFKGWWHLVAFIDHYK